MGPYGLLDEGEELGDDVVGVARELDAMRMGEERERRERKMCQEGEEGEKPGKNCGGEKLLVPGTNGECIYVFLLCVIK